MSVYRLSLCVIFLGFLSNHSAAQEDRGFKVFQFPKDKIPRIDGETSDWDIYPDSFAIGTDQLREDLNGYPLDARNLDVKVRVGWVKGMNRLYFLYEANDDYWDFSGPGLRNDTFEVVVDGDMSGGPFISDFHPFKGIDPSDAYFSFHGVHAQNYHIFTPAEGKGWAMVWGSQPWIKDMPYANSACAYNFRHGESGRLVLEFWVTVFDYAGNDQSRAVETIFYEGRKIGLSWAVIDYDNAPDAKRGFWNLSKSPTMYGNASGLLVFRLMPLAERFTKRLEAEWSFKVVDPGRRIVAFKDRSHGVVTSRKWDFGDGAISTLAAPEHEYARPGKYVVVLYVEGPDGTSRKSKVWDVAVP
jgi:hypothetical protein